MTEKNINMNMLRERALRLPDVTEIMYLECHIENRNIVDEYLSVSSHLSIESKKQYVSALHQFLYWIHISLNDKPFYKITKRDFMRYMSYLSNRQLSSSALKFKKSTVSSLNGYIENIVSEDKEGSPEYANFRNFTRGLPPIPKNQVYNKIAISLAEYELMITTLLNDENYLACAWVTTMFNVGCRRAGVIQFKTEILSYPKIEGQNYILSNIVKEKGRAGGKFVQYMVNEEALKYMKLWIDKRGYEHEYIFTLGNPTNPRQMSKEWADTLCEEVLSDICMRRINVHLFKASCITTLLESGVDIKLVSKYVAQHEDISTTSIYDLRTFDTEKKQIFSKMPSTNFIKEDIPDQAIEPVTNP